MKYLKLFESQNIEEICKKYGIENWTLNPDGTVDVDGNVYLLKRKLDKIPFNFGTVSGLFDCRNNNLKDLVGCPKRVGMSFVCDGNDITSLEGCPTYIGRYFFCRNKNLWSFEGFPRHAKTVSLLGAPIEHIFKLFRTVYEKDGGEYFSTSGTLMDFFQDCDPVWPNKIIKKRRMNNFLSSIGKELSPIDIGKLKNVGWKIED